MSVELVPSAPLGADLLSVDTFTIVAAVLGLVAAILTFADFAERFRIERSRKYPKKLYFAIRQRTLSREIFRLKRTFEKDLPDVVVGVHYGGMAYATLIAREFYKPLVMAFTRLNTEPNGKRSRCVEVQLQAPPGTFTDKVVWVVDNRIHTGRTIEMVRDAVVADGAARVETFVIHANRKETPQVYEPDHIVYLSSRRFRHLVR